MWSPSIDWNSRCQYISARVEESDETGADTIIRSTLCDMGWSDMECVTLMCRFGAVAPLQMTMNSPVGHYDTGRR